MAKRTTGCGSATRCRLVDEEASDWFLTNRVADSEVATGPTLVVTRGSGSIDVVSTRGRVLTADDGVCQLPAAEREPVELSVFLVAEFSGCEEGELGTALRAVCQALGASKQSTKSTTSKRNWGQSDFS